MIDQIERCSTSYNRERCMKKRAKMKYRIEYVIYNNVDFTQVFFCDTKDEAEVRMDQLKKLNHVTCVTITPTDGGCV